MAELVGLQLKLAYEFEDLLVPLPFEWLEVWCKVVGVPFADYLIVYWASEEAYFQKLEREREAQETEAARERGDTQDAPALTATAAPASSNPTVNRGGGILAPLRVALARVAKSCCALFSTPKETSE